MSSSGKDKQKSSTSRGKSSKSGKSYGRKSGGAPRKYSKGKNTSSKTGSIDPIPGNQNWGGLARKGVLRVHHDDVKAAEEQTNRPDPFEEVFEDEDVLRLREERAQKREQRDARKRELQAEAKAALDRANSKTVRKSEDAKRPTQIKQYKRKPLSNKRNNNQDVSAKLRKILGSADSQKAYKRLREADAFFQQDQFPEAKRKLAPLIKKAGKVSIDLKVAKETSSADLIHRAVLRQLANKRQGTASTLTRSEVRGGGRKPYKQKGTGRARQGSIRTPLRLSLIHI